MYFLHIELTQRLRLVLVLFTADEHYPLEVGVVDTDAGDEVTEDLRDAAEKQDNGDDGKKDESFVVNLHGLPYSATLEDIVNFLDGLFVYCDLRKMAVYSSKAYML